MKLTRSVLRRMILAEMKRLSEDDLTDAEYDDIYDGRGSECLDPMAPPWQDFLKTLSAVGVPYKEWDLGSEESLSVEIQFEDIMDNIQPSGMRAIMTTHSRKHPSYALIADYYPRDAGVFDDWGDPSQNDLVITLADISVLEESWGIENFETESGDWHYVSREAMTKIPGPSC